MSLNIPVISSTAGLSGDSGFYGRVIESQILAFLSKIALTEEVKCVRLDNQSGTDVLLISPMLLVQLQQAIPKSSAH